MVKSAGGDERQNSISLVRNPDQRLFDDPTPVPVEPFHSGFLGYSIEDLGNYVNTHLLKPQGGVTPGTFAVLDERSMDDDTLVVARWTERFTDYALDHSEFTDEHKTFEGWKVRRINFHQANPIIGMLTIDERFADESWWNAEGAVVNEAGVFSLPG
ncbi:MAG: hypothetical protein M1828_003167 [Chrysothrix sp. TS-e1954]|nr:MAG: hypothetical protein M1828_003167 [Chrysothrix sp. TS-e1954]